MLDVIAHYRVGEKLGAGGMGEVYRATDTKLGRQVALKVLPEAFAQDAERMARFEREAQVLASLNHPNIAAIYGVEEAGQSRALVMELVEGPTLAERIAARPLAVEETLGIARQIAEALEEAHDKGIVHRDLKPANVKVTEDGKVKVLDFGLAKALEGEPGSGSVANSPTLSIASTRLGVILGTAGYMSPEQARGVAVDRRADIWAFGVLLYEMLVGKPMFGGPTVSDTLAAVLRAEVDLTALPAGVPAGLRRLLARCLERDKRKRLQAIGEARLLLEEGFREEKTEDRRQRTEGGRGWLAATAVCALAAVGLAVVHFREAPPEERTLRFFVAPPPKAAVDTFAVSPDGRYLAMAVAGETRALWVRALDLLEPQMLPGTDGSRYPFWSPDSKWIGFFAQGKLKKTAVTGGPPQTLCDAPDGRGGTWSREGVIVFSPSPSGVLQRVASAGGPPVEATSLDATGGGIHRFPWFFPDGRRFLFLASRGQPEGGVYSGSLDSKEVRRVLAEQSSVAYAPVPGGKTGHLLFVRERTLMAQSFDPGPLQTRGEPFPVAERVGFTNLAYGDYAVSASGVLAYVSGAVAFTTQLTWFDRDGKQLGVVGAPGSQGNLAISPDEKRVALDRAEGASQNVDVWVLELARGTASRLTFGPGTEAVPVWSPDGSQVAFTGLREGRFRILQKASSGAGQEVALGKIAPTGELVVDWSRDGRMLLCQVFGGPTKFDLWLWPTTGDKKPVPFLQTEFDETEGQFSPDGKKVAYVSNETGRHEVYVQPAPPTGAKWQVSNAGGRQPRWRRDGKELFYLGADQRLMVVDVRGGTTFEAGTPRALFATRMPAPNPNFVHLYDVSADGRRFLVNTQAGEAAQTPVSVVVNWQARAGK